MTQIEDKLGAAVGRDIFIVSLPVIQRMTRPRDSRPIQNLRHGPGWSFVTGKPGTSRDNYRLGECAARC